MIIYLDSDFKCCLTDNNSMMSFETNFFDGKCQSYIEGYRIVPFGKSWVREDGVVFVGEMIAPWKPYTELAATQAGYEKAQADMQTILAEANATITELDTALLEATYINLTGGDNLAYD